MSIWDPISSPSKTSNSADVGGLWGGVSSPTPKSVPAVPKESIWSGAVASTTPAQTAQQKSPYFAAVDKKGNSFGFSDQLDSSGKPLFAYRAPGDTATTTDKTRIATTFDPRVAQKVDSKTFLNERSVANRAALKEALGGTYSDELDHKISLELSGSNQKENLMIQPGLKGGAAAESDKIENQLAKAVTSGKMSLFDAQVQLAKQKGITVPFTGVHDNILTNALGHISNYFNDPTTYGGIIKNTVTGIPATEVDVGKHIFKATAGALNSLDQATARPEDSGPATVVSTAPKPKNIQEAIDGSTSTIPYSPAALDFIRNKAKISYGTLPDGVGGSTQLPHLRPTGVSSGSSIIIGQDQPSVVINHEIFNSLFLNSSTKPSDFNKAWDTAVKSNPDLKVFDSNLKDPKYSSAFESNGESVSKDPYYLATERFALLGSTWGKEGISSIPKELQPFYAKYLTDHPTQQNAHVQATPPKDVATTLKELPSSIVENLPFGVGEIVKEIRDNPDMAANLSASDVIKGLPEAAKNIAKGFIADPVLTLAGAILSPFNAVAGRKNYGGEIHFNVPGLGEVSNLQYEVAQKVAKGAPQIQTVVEAAPNAIFDTLMFVGAMQSVFGGRPVTLLKSEAPDGFTAKNPAQSFRYYDEPTNQTAIPNNVLEKIAQEKGIELGKDYNPENPSYFRVTGKANGSVVGELYQVRPSLVDSIWSGVKGTPTSAHTGIIPLYSQEVSLSSIKDSVAGAIKNVSETYKNLPNKQGGFVKIPSFGEDKGQSTDTSQGQVKDTAPLPSPAEGVAKNKDILEKGSLPRGEGSAPIKPFEGFTDVTTKTLEDLKGRSTVSKQFISDLTNKGEIKQAERDTIRQVLSEYPENTPVPVAEFADKVRAELLPLTRETIPSKQQRYESISLPEKIRGNISNYREHVYNSPIKTSAGSNHFNSLSDDLKDRYFAHTRVENLSPSDADISKVNHIETALKKGYRMEGERQIGRRDPKDTLRIKQELDEAKQRIENAKRTRRVIEVQSDLYQKGNLEKEQGHWTFLEPGENLIRYQERTGKTSEEISLMRQTELSKLKQYNNPTAHFRVVREEIKQAAKDGIKKLQFPTGETAMKIEGLGETSRWTLNTLTDADYARMPFSEVLSANRQNVLTPDKLKVGAEVIQNNIQGATDAPWIITDVLGDGKFKAVTKSVYDRAIPSAFDGKPTVQDSMKETFDISGKVDTNNPIYKFYDKDLQKYLSRFGGQKITDAQGQTWVEIPIKSELANKPVEAYKISSTGKSKLRTGESWTPKEALGVVRQFFTPAESEFIPTSSEISIKDMRNILSDKEIKGLSFRGVDPETAKLRSFIEVLVTDGKVPDGTVLHEIFEKAVQIAFDDGAFGDVVKKTIKNPLTVFLKDYYAPDVYTSKELQAKETLADDFAEYVRDKTGYKGQNESLWKKLLQWVRKIWRKMTGAQSLYDDLLAGKRMKNPDTLSTLGDEYGLSVEEQPEPEQLVEDMEIYKRRLNQLKRQYDLKKEEIESGVTPQNSEDGVNREYLNDTALRDIGREVQSLSQKLKNTRKQVNESVAVQEAERVSKLNPEITEANSGAYPKPTKHGGLIAPEINWTKLKDKSVLSLTRETMERNFEKVASPEDAKKLNGFLVDAIRGNELARVEYSNKYRKDFGAKIKEWGIKRNSDDDALIQVFGEGRMSLTELQKATPKWKEVQQAAGYFRQIYDELLNNWNAMRRAYSYEPVKARPDYFRHFTDINDFAKHFGFITNDAELPTSIAGETAHFNPGKPFSTAEMHRTGDRTKFSAIGGMDNYLDTVARQMFHIDSIQRANALINYLKEAATLAEKNPSPDHKIDLPGFKTNLIEYKRLIAGKSSALDHAVESTLAGRKVLRAMSKIQQAFGKNVIMGNISAATSHLIPLNLTVATTGKIPLIKGLYNTLVAPFQPEGSLTTIDGVKSSFLTRRFPTRFIVPSKFEKTKEAIGYIFESADRFISRLTIAGKYYENIAKGLNPKEAMRLSDNYAQRVIGDRSIGNLPNIMNTKTLGFLTQFQVEINDNISVLIHDIPKWGKESEKSTLKTASMFIQFAIYAYLFNQLLKKIKGSGKGFDIIGLGLELAGLDDTTANKPIGQRSLLVGQEVLGELPFSSLFTGNFPIAQALPSFSDLVSGKTTFGHELLKLGVNFASPVGGGAQIQKTIYGLNAFRKGQAEDKGGVPTYKIGQNIPNALRAILFGPSAFPEKQQNYQSGLELKDLSALTTKKDKEFLPTYNEIMGLVSSGNEAEATTKWNALTPEDQKTFKRLNSSAKAKDTITRQKNILPKVKEVMELLKDKKEDEASKIWSDLSPEDQKAFTSVYKKLNP